ncbi:MAG TPA: Na+/H+ antiporter NhaA [Solirubrobacteraceae bacterium]|jgi:Na+/H+ antiporter NhaA|nr:Na+/H+ antiporter NhaA [Solirubrobacteraceae bacterium]
MTTESGASGGRTAWARNLAAPVRNFLSTETGSAAVLLGATVAALFWANVSAHTYDAVWGAKLTVRLAGGGVSTDLRHWVNQGLMTFFFLVVGLEAKREMDVGDLRQRRRLAIPVLAAIGGMIVPIAIYELVNIGGHGGRGWGAAMSTDTAFALGALSLITPRAATRLRVFLLTLAVFDDLGGILVISTVYTTHVSWVALVTAVALFAGVAALRYIAFPGRRQVTIVIGVAIWVAMFKSGIDPVLTGLAVGLITSAYPPTRESLEQATALTRSFREQPTPELARSAQLSVLSAISPNERIQYSLHPWTGYVIVPLFALANAGIHITGGLLGDALTSTITLGILLGYIVGKPLGILGASWLASRPRMGGQRPTISWPVLTTGGAIAGMGFTVSLLISSLAFSGERLSEAKLGALFSILLAPAVSYGTIRLTRRLPQDVRARQLAGTAEDLLDLADDIDPERDHIRGPQDASVTLVEYGDFECPYCGQAETVIRELMSQFGDELRYVWRHLPLSDVHTSAQVAAEASEAAGAQGRFWEAYDLLLAHTDVFTPRDLREIGEAIGLDMDRFWDDVRKHVYAPRIAEDVSSADASGVAGTPTFFINRRRHQGAYDVDTLATAVRAARQRARLLQTAAAAAE